MREKLRGLIDGFYLNCFAPTNRKLTDHLLANDVVPVVRCKDCKHYDKDALWCNINSPMFSEEHYNWYEDDFCSIGERKDNA